MTDRELMQQSFERTTGIADAWTNPALMQARNGFIQGWEAARLSTPESEPVAWEYCGALFYNKEEVFAWHERGDISDAPPKPLYDAPPQREYMPDDLIAMYEKGFADGKAQRKPWDNKVPITDEYERGVIDGMQKQMQSSVDRAVNRMSSRERVQFPTMLRKMWSGSEVQAWLDENVNQGKNNG